jgi:MCP family monocarboxylic acid transporter-like MFS transporter 10
VLPVVVSQMSPVERLGGRIGAFYSVCAVAQLVGSPIGGMLVFRGDDGWIREGQGAYLWLIIFAVRWTVRRVSRG